MVGVNEKHQYSFVSRLHILDNANRDKKKHNENNTQYTNITLDTIHCLRYI
jgi:hypothetical protein